MNDLQDALDRLNQEDALFEDWTEGSFDDFLIIQDAARRVANPDMQAAAREYVRLRFGDSGFTKEEAFDASLIVVAALGIDPPEDTG